MTKRGLIKGFTILEAVLALGVGAIVVGGVVRLFMVVSSKAMSETYSISTSYGTNIFETIPSAGQFQRAANVAIRLQDLMDNAAAIFVLGGYRSQPQSSATSGMLGPLAAGTLFSSVPGITAANLPQTSYNFRAILSTQSGVTFDGSPDPGDFTVITLTGLNTVSSITQVRRITTTIDGTSTVLYEVVLDTNLSAGRDATEGSGTQNRFSYRIALPATEDANWTIAPGALHYWLRYDLSWNRCEEGPARIVFPDPFLLNGAQPAADTAPFSRFMFFVSPNT